MALIVTDALKFRESENDQFRRLSLSANFNTPVPVSQGGTGATTAAQAAKNLNVLPLGEVVTKIPSGADLNDYVLPGVYAIGGNSTATTIANMPFQSAGTLRVFSSAGNAITASSAWKYLIQEYIVFTGARYQRFGGSGSGTAVTWSAWETIYNSSDFQSDANYCKMPDGTLMCWGVLSGLSPRNLTGTPVGTLYYHEYALNVTFPVPFTSIPSMTVSPLSGRVCSISWVVVNATSFSEFDTLSANQTLESTRKLSASWQAIGRWK